MSDYIFHKGFWRSASEVASEQEERIAKLEDTVASLSESMGTLLAMDAVNRLGPDIHVDESGNIPVNTALYLDPAKVGTAFKAFRKAAKMMKFGDIGTPMRIPPRPVKKGSDDG